MDEVPMSLITAISVEEAQRSMNDGYVYIDVRNELEFEQGHPAGAYNVPLTQMTDFGPELNEQFVEVINYHFGTDAKLLIGCGIGVSSRKAASLLRDAGYCNVLEVKEGFNGCRDAFGRKSPGWLERGLPVEYGQPESRSFEALSDLPRRKVL
jgi:rhodanese-related sulfurtransferase